MHSRFNSLPSADEVRELLSFLPADNRDMWVKTARILGRCYPHNEEIFGIFRDWASTYRSRKAADAQHERKEFDSAPNDGQDYGIGVLIAEAKSRGWTPKRRSELDHTPAPVEIIKPAPAAPDAEPSWEEYTYAKIVSTASAISKFLFLCPSPAQRASMLAEISDDGIKFFPPPYNRGIDLLAKYCRNHDEYTWPAFEQWVKRSKDAAFPFSELSALIGAPERPQNFDNCRDFWRDLQVTSLALLSVQSAASFAQRVKERPYAAASELTTLIQSLSPKAPGRLYADPDFDELIASDVRETRDPELKLKIFVPTYIAQLDECIQGWRRGEVSILAAHSGVGKTWFGIDASLRLLEHGHRVLFISAEMDAKSIARRMFTASEEISNTVYQDPHSPLQMHLDNFHRKMSTGRFMLYAGRGTKIEDIEAQISRCELTGGLDLVIVDYLQLIENRRGGDQVWERVYNTMRRLTQVAQRCNVPVLVLAQLNNPNRNPQQSTSKGGKKVRAPGLYDLADSTAVVRDAAAVLAFYREDNDDRTSLTLKILKNRYGGKVEDIRMKMSAGGALRELPKETSRGYESIVRYGAEAHLAALSETNAQEAAHD